MEKDNVRFLKEKEIQKKAKKNLASSSYIENPLEAKFITFCDTKKNIKIKDLL